MSGAVYGFDRDGFPLRGKIMSMSVIFKNSDLKRANIVLEKPMTPGYYAYSLTGEVLGEIEAVGDSFDGSPWTGIWFYEFLDGWDRSFYEWDPASGYVYKDAGVRSQVKINDE